MLNGALLDRLLVWWRAHTKTVVVAAVAVLISGAGVFAVEEMRLRADRIAARTHEAAIENVLTAPDATIRTVPLRDGGSLTLVRTVREDAGVVLLTDAKPVGPSRRYQIWLIEGASSRPVGLLAPDQVAVTLAVDGINRMNTLAVTIEDGAGTNSPTLPLIGEIPLS